MDWTHYRFRSLWDLPAPPATVYQVLERVEDYPRWWPQVREVTRLDDTSGVIRVRALLPYDLWFVARTTTPKTRTSTPRRAIAIATAAAGSKSTSTPPSFGRMP